MLYSSYEPAAERWLVFASRRDRPRVTAPSDWRERAFVTWDHLQVHLPTDAIFAETSPIVRGTAFRREDILQPLSQRHVDYLAVGGTLVGLLWALLKPLFSKEAT